MFIRSIAINDKHSSSSTYRFFNLSVGNEKCVQLLIESGAFVNVKDKNGDEPLQIAFKEGNEVLNFI